MSIQYRFRLNGTLARGKARVWPVAEIACLALVLASCPGCGDDSPQATIEGTLRLDGEPLDNCLITFLPEGGEQSTGPHSIGLTDRHGSYRLRRADQREGASIGWHRVTIEDLSMSTGLRRRDHGTVDVQPGDATSAPPVRPSRVGRQYSFPSGTPLRKEVIVGHQVIDLDIE